MVKPWTKRATALVGVVLVAAVTALPAQSAMVERRPVIWSPSALWQWVEAIVSAALNGLEPVWDSLGHGGDPDGVQSACTASDPACDPELGHGGDPDG